MENFYLFLICFFFCGMVCHSLLIEEKKEDLSLNALAENLFVLVVIFFSTTATYGTVITLFKFLRSYLSGA
jgi:hypothetical protein